jgi:hypothetical protein
MKKYCDLVWLARKLPDDWENPIIKLQIDVVCNKYPTETNDLLYNDEQNWHHGFNSGILAALRLVSCARIYPENIEEFPMLDT